MERKRSKAEIAGIVLFSFCLFVFVLMDCGAIFMAIHDKFEFHQMVRLLLFLALITWSAYQALRARVKRSNREELN
jgi:hypothetical protein